MQASLPKVLIFFLVVHLSHLQADDPQDVLQNGRQADYYIAAHFASGYWEKKKGDKFLCPILSEVVQTKIAIYTKEPNAETMALAVALDRTIQKFPQLDRSFLIVSEESRSESMTDDELAIRIKQLQELGKQHGIEKLSLAYLQYSDTPSRWRNSLGFFGSSDVVVAVVEPGISLPAKNTIEGRRLPTRTVKPFYRFVMRINSKDMDQQAAEAVIEKAMSSLSE